MQSLDFSFLKITPLGILDVILVALILYQLYTLIKGTIAANIFIGLFLIYAIYFLVRALHMPLLTAILGKLWMLGR